MIVREYIKAFEKLGFGMFVHFGAYSQLGMGEWVKEVHHVPDEEYFKAVERFMYAIFLIHDHKSNRK